MIEGTLHRMMSGQWAVCRSGRSPIEIRNGDEFLVEVNGKLRSTRMEFVEDGRGYHSVDGFELMSGLRVALKRPRTQ